jgi:hypothetical protein
MELTTALAQLEQAAAAVGRLLPDDDEGLKLVAEAWGPLMPKGYQARRWHPFWIAWLQDCAERVPVVPSRVTHGENWTGPEPLLTSHQHDDVMGCGIDEAKPQ